MNSRVHFLSLSLHLVAQKCCFCPSEHEGTKRDKNFVNVLYSRHNGGTKMKKQVKIPANKDLSKAKMETTCKQKKRFYLPDG